MEKNELSLGIVSFVIGGVSEMETGTKEFHALLNGPEFPGRLGPIFTLRPHKMVLYIRVNLSNLVFGKPKSTYSSSSS